MHQSFWCTSDSWYININYMMWNIDKYKIEDYIIYMIDNIDI